MRCLPEPCSHTTARSSTKRPARRWRVSRHDRRRHCALYIHAGGFHGLRGDFTGARHPAHAAHVGIELRARNRAGRCDGRTGRRRRHTVARHRIPGRGVGRRKCRRRLCGDGAHAQDVRHCRQEACPQEIGTLAVPSATTIQTLTQLSYLIAAALFILGLKRMSSPVTAVSGVRWAGLGMLLATIVTLVSVFMGSSTTNLALVVGAIAVGGAVAWISGKRVAMTDMPQMIALYNGMGGGAAAAIAAVELYSGNEHNLVHLTMATVGGFIGAVSFSGSLIAFAKLQGLITKSVRFSGQKFLNLAILLVVVGLGTMVVSGLHAGPPVISAFFALSLLLGVAMTLPIGGADMPVVISLYNALTGLAVGFEGFVLDNAAMIIAGTVVGAAGTLLTQLMAKAMNRSLGNVLFSNFGESSAAGGGGVTGTQKAIEASDAGVMMAYSQKIIIVPGYGLAVAQAQHKVWELTQLLMDHGVKVRFAIHPVAGRMPGHMNVLLAEAGVPYDLISDLDEINAEFETADVALIIGANDVVNPDARTNKGSPIYGMPILNADKAKNVIVIKRGQGQGFSGIDNALFVLDQTRMLYGDAQAAVSQLIQAVKAAG